MGWLLPTGQQARVSTQKLLTFPRREKGGNLLPSRGCSSAGCAGALSPWQEAWPRRPCLHVAPVSMSPLSHITVGVQGCAAHTAGSALLTGGTSSAGLLLPGLSRCLSPARGSFGSVSGVGNGPAACNGAVSAPNVTICPSHRSVPAALPPAAPAATSPAAAPGTQSSSVTPRVSH